VLHLQLNPSPEYLEFVAGGANLSVASMISQWSVRPELLFYLSVKSFLTATGHNISYGISTPDMFDMMSNDILFSQSTHSLLANYILASCFRVLMLC
jgi:hypothetical protein